MTLRTVFHRRGNNPEARIANVMASHPGQGGVVDPNLLLPTQLDKIKNLYVAVRTGTLKVSAIPLIPSFRPIYRQCSGARPGGLSPL